MANPYNKSHRLTVLDPKQVVAVKRIGKEMLSSIQIMTDDRIAEDENLRILQSRGYEKELEVAREEILKLFKAEVRKMTFL